MIGPNQHLHDKCPTVSHEHHTHHSHGIAAFDSSLYSVESTNLKSITYTKDVAVSQTASYPYDIGKQKTLCDSGTTAQNARLLASFSRISVQFQPLQRSAWVSAYYHLVSFQTHKCPSHGSGLVLKPFAAKKVLSFTNSSNQSYS